MNYTLAFVLIALVAVGVWIAYGYFAIKNIEEPKYTVVSVANGYEIRRYDEQIVAEARAPGSYRDALNTGFRLIADYIFGNNTTSSSIAMTAPVGETVAKSAPIAMTVPVGEVQSGTDHIISFVMPSKYTMDTIPKPNNKAVTLRVVPPRTVAVLRYSGFTGNDVMDAKKVELKTLLAKDNVKTIGEPEGAFYNPPWTPPFMRRNEVLIEIAQ
jgi:SOUL heme-binding protein